MNSNRSFELIVCSLVSSAVLILLLINQLFFSILVVENKPEKADVAIVLGGGGGSRLNKAVELFKDGYFNRAILVDEKKSYWNHIAEDLCDTAQYRGLPVECLTGSVNTITDATLTLEYCLKNNISKALVVTESFHSRRAELVFNDVYMGRGIEINVIHSGSSGLNGFAENYCWLDGGNLKKVFMEFVKIAWFKLH